MGGHRHCHSCSQNPRCGAHSFIHSTTSAGRISLRNANQHSVPCVRYAPLWTHTRSSCGISPSMR